VQVYKFSVTGNNSAELLSTSLFHPKGKNTFDKLSTVLGNFFSERHFKNFRVISPLGAARFHEQCVPCNQVEPAASFHVTTVGRRQSMSYPTTASIERCDGYAQVS
jgi:hypothetical protein